MSYIQNLLHNCLQFPKILSESKLNWCWVLESLVGVELNLVQLVVLMFQIENVETTLQFRLWNWHSHHIAPFWHLIRKKSESEGWYDMQTEAEKDLTMWKWFEKYNSKENLSIFKMLKPIFVRINVRVFFPV